MSYTEQKKETDGFVLASALTSAPSYAVHTAMCYYPFLVPMDTKNDEKEAEEEDEDPASLKNLKSSCDSNVIMLTK